MKKSVNVKFERNIDLDILKEDIFSAVENSLIENYGIDDPEEDIEDYYALVVDALIYSIKQFYPNSTVKIE